MANEVLGSIQIRAPDSGTHLEVRVEGVLKLQSGELPYIYIHLQLNHWLFLAQYHRTTFFWQCHNLKYGMYTMEPTLIRTSF